MKLEKQVCTIEQAKRLAELSVSQEGEYSWGCNDEFDNIPPSTWTLFRGKKWVNKRYSAFTVAELGIMIPAGYNTMYCTNDGWRGFDLDGKDMCDSATYDTEAHARAEILIHLLLTKVIAPAEVNARLANS